MSLNQLSNSVMAGNALDAKQASQTLVPIQATPHQVSQSSDAEQFAQSLVRYKARETGPAANVSSLENSNSLGSRVISNVAEISSNLAEEHKRITALIEKATASGDSRSMVSAMMQLGTYNQQAQMVTKVVSKAATGLETLTRLQ